MSMISFIFLGFVAVVYFFLFFGNKIVKSKEMRIFASNLILLVSSYIFVAYADFRFAIVLAFLTLSTWFFSKKSKYTVVGVIIALAALSFFKYTNFFAESIAAIIGNDYTFLNIILPLGISYYSFSAISYLVDVKRGKTEPRSLLDVALYLSFFPKLTSGPIQSSGDFFAQTDCERNLDRHSFTAGIQIFVFGLFKKIVIADRLSVFINQVYETPMAFGSLTVFFAVIAYSLQIYFDFSGYSDMAIGISKLLGINLPRNFNLPYLSHNVSEFWKRWHITLSSWLQEYLYFSLGGSRKGKIRTYINLILTMTLGGIWHGANQTYVFWGLLHGIALVVHKVWMKITDSPNKSHSPFSNLISILGTFLFTSFCWIFFRADSISQAFTIIQRIFSFKSGLEQPYLWLFFGIIVLVGCSIFAFLKSKKLNLQCKRKNVSFVDGYYPILDLTKFWQLVIFFVFVGLLICLAYTGGSPFIYGKY